MRPTARGTVAGMDQQQNDALSEQLQKNIELAEGIKCPLTVEGRPFRQAGQGALAARCPCGCEFALSGEGKHLCRHCNRWVQVVHP